MSKADLKPTKEQLQKQLNAIAKQEEKELIEKHSAIAKLPVSRSTFYKGDCLVEMSKIADESIDLVVTDPPKTLLMICTTADRYSGQYSQNPLLSASAVKLKNTLL